MYGFTTTLTGTTFDQALAKTLAALKAEGFGVLSTAVPCLTPLCPERRR